MSITQGFEKASSLVRRAEPRFQAVCEVKPGKRSERSMDSICSSSRGCVGIVDSADILEVGLL